MMPGHAINPMPFNKKTSRLDVQNTRILADPPSPYFWYHLISASPPLPPTPPQSSFRMCITLIFNVYIWLWDWTLFHSCLHSPHQAVLPPLVKTWQKMTKSPLIRLPPLSRPPSLTQTQNFYILPIKALLPTIVTWRGTLKN